MSRPVICRISLVLTIVLRAIPHEGTEVDNPRKSQIIGDEGPRKPGGRRTLRRGGWRPHPGYRPDPMSVGEGSVVYVSQKSADPGSWRDLPPAPPPHGSFLAWYQGCRCGPCEASGQGFLGELARRRAQRRDGDEPYAVRLSADQRAHLEPAVRTRDCPRCGALRYHRCRDPHFPLHFSATHPERASA